MHAKEVFFILALLSVLLLVSSVIITDKDLITGYQVNGGEIQSPYGKVPSTNNIVSTPNPIPPATEDKDLKKSKTTVVIGGKEYLVEGKGKTDEEAKKDRDKKVDELIKNKKGRAIDNSRINTIPSVNTNLVNNAGLKLGEFVKDAVNLGKSGKEAAKEMGQLLPGK